MKLPGCPAPVCAAQNMDDWDQETLEKVVKEKHGAEKPINATAIICKFFLDAVEKRQYGWFWKCPNGADCKYRHALPPGYVLKSQMKELLEEEAKNAKDITEVIEEQRQKVDAKTPITEEVRHGRCSTACSTQETSDACNNKGEADSELVIDSTCAPHVPEGRLDMLQVDFAASCTTHDVSAVGRFCLPPSLLYCPVV